MLKKVYVVDSDLRLRCGLPRLWGIGMGGGIVGTMSLVAARRDVGAASTSGL